ncbi:MAG: hypothetical protein WAV48_07130, partial [Candidatus Magasanikiibacteriota bacterium]
MKEYITKHKWHLVSLILLIIIAGVSGYYNFTNTIHDSLNTTQNKNQILSKIQNSDEKKVEENSNNSTTTITNYQLPITNTATTITTSKTTTTSGSDTTSSTLTTASPVIPHPEPEFQNPIIFTVAGEEYTLEYKENQSVYEFMQTLSADSKKPFIFEVKKFPGLGYFVESINDIKNDGQTGKYWIYYI